MEPEQQNYSLASALAVRVQEEEPDKKLRLGTIGVRMAQDVGEGGGEYGLKFNGSGSEGKIKTSRITRITKADQHSMTSINSRVPASHVPA